MDTIIKLPFYAKAALFLIGLYIFINILYISQAIILPLIYATILAIILSPAVGFLVRKNISRAISVAGVLLVTLLIVAGFIDLLSSQASHFHQAWPKLLDKLQDLLKATIIWASGFFNISVQKISGWVTEIANDAIKNRNAALGTTITTMGGILAATILTPVYIFMLLFYEPHLLQFLHKVFGAENDNKVIEILSETKNVIQRYMVGLLAEFVIIAFLNSAGLLALHMEYAVLLGVIGAMLDVIPIIGGIICVTLFVIIALLTKPTIYVLYVVGIFALIRIIDDYYIFPKIVGSKGKLNVMISVFAVILGDALWGIPGMLIAIPLIAVVKLFCDRFDALKSWGFLLGESNPETADHVSYFSLKHLVSIIGSKFRKSE
jgi:predicted PurR-regulated permease PerM